MELDETTTGRREEGRGGEREEDSNEGMKVDMIPGVIRLASQRPSCRLRFMSCRSSARVSGGSGREGRETGSACRGGGVCGGIYGSRGQEGRGMQQCKEEKGEAGAREGGRSEK